MLAVREAHLGPAGFDLDAYQATLDSLMDQTRQLDKAARDATLDVLEDARRRVVQALADAGPASQAMFQQSKAAVDQAVSDFVAKYTADVADLQRRGFDLGTALATQPLVDGGLLFGVAAIGEDLLGVAQGFSADLIQGLGQELRQRINSELVSVAVGTSTPTDAIRAVGRNLRSPNHFRTIGARAQAIVTTEVGRIISVSSQANMAAIAEQVPELRKRWVHSGVGEPRENHVEAGARYGPDGSVGPIGVDDRYQIAGVAVLYPRAGNLPAAETVFCRCQSVPWIPDDEVEREPATPLTPVPDVPETTPVEPATRPRTWGDFGVKLPRSKERAKILNDALADVMDTPMGPKFAEALRMLVSEGGVKFSLKSVTQPLKKLGHVRFMVNPRTGQLSQRQLFIELGRDYDQDKFAKWSRAETEEFFRLRGERPPLDDFDAYRAFDLDGQMKAWRRKNPRPQRRLASADEIAQTLAHELTHAVDLLDGRKSHPNEPGPIAKLLRTDKIFDKVKALKAAGDDTFWYAATSPDEALAELTSFYLRGTTDRDGASINRTAFEWRDAYPDLAEWVETNVPGIT